MNCRAVPLTIALLLVVVLVLGCGGTAIAPQDRLALFIDDAEKDRRARDLVRFLRDERRASILSVSHVGPTGYRLKAVVERFANRAAIRYDAQSYDFIFKFDVKFEPAVAMGRKAVVSTTLIRGVSQRQGFEPYLISRQAMRCSSDSRCGDHVEHLAEASLYSFIHP